VHQVGNQYIVILISVHLAPCVYKIAVTIRVFKNICHLTTPWARRRSQNRKITYL